MPKCMLCGCIKANLQPHIKFSHKMTVSEYRSQFNNAPVYDYNPADRLQKWAKENPDAYKRSQSKGGKSAVGLMNKYLKDHPDIRREIASKGGIAANGKNLKDWRSSISSEELSSVCAKAGHMSSLSKGHEYMARIALQNNRFCKYLFESEHFNISSRKFASNWEINFIKLCETIPEVTSLVHEPFGIPYCDENKKMHKYYPDFLLNDHYIIEIKPEGCLSDQFVQFKKQVAQDFCKDNKQYEYHIITESILPTVRNGEITTSAQQELKAFLKI